MAEYATKNDRLEVVISNTRPVALLDLTLSLLSFNSQFEKFRKAVINEPDINAETTLLIKEVRSGSIVFELISVALPAVPLLFDGSPLFVDWVNFFKQTMDWLLKKNEKPPRSMSKKDLEEWGKILEPVAKDNGSTFSIKCMGNDNVINANVIFTSCESNAAKEFIENYLEANDSTMDKIYTRKVMYWDQAKFSNSNNKSSGDKAIIDGISDKPLKVIFNENCIKNNMMEIDDRFEKPWHKLAYIVDVEVQTVRNVPKVYKILKFYSDDTFDPDS